LYHICFVYVLPGFIVKYENECPMSEHFIRAVQSIYPEGLELYIYIAEVIKINERTTIPSDL